MSSENLRWLDSLLSSIPENREIIFYSSFPINSDIDNWDEITNRLRDKNIKAFIVGSSQSKNNITQYSNVKSAICASSGNNKNYWNYNIITENPDSLIFYSSINKKTRQWGIIEKDSAIITSADSPPFEDYSDSFGKLKINTRVTLLWKKHFNKTLTSAICAGNNHVYISAADGNIYCLNPDGNEIWKYSSNELLAGGPVNSSGNLILGTLQGDLISLDDSTGYVVQSIGLNTPITSQLTIIKGEYNGQMTSGVIIGTSKGDLYFYEAGTFEMIWENHSASGVIKSKPLFINNRIIFTCSDGYLYCVDAGSGIINWKWKDTENLSSPSSCNPVSDGRNVYIVSPDNYLYAIDLMLGRTVWRKDYGTFASIGISSDKKKILIKSKSNYFYEISTSGGKLEQKIKADFREDYLQNTPVYYHENVLFCSRNGNIYFVDGNGICGKLFFMGNSPLLDIIKLKENVFIASNKDGNIIAFKLE